jgi:hypothetical protein
MSSTNLTPLPIITFCPAYTRLPITTSADGLILCPVSKFKIECQSVQVIMMSDENRQSLPIVSAVSSMASLFQDTQYVLIPAVILTDDKPR